ncbi:hypothetical protein V3851_00800 [Paenibacillus sp. M1]|uniref:Helix-turn-helix domain-containing protein n=1 Tax=Paenibacillus haidiansis TaxID=1574488 RepID=A0ABU7VNA9_9BACL
MDKRKVIEAYRRGFLTLQECAQILGVEKTQIIDILDHAATEMQRSQHEDHRHATGNL